VVVTSLMSHLDRPGGRGDEPLMQAVFMTRIGRRAGYLVKYQFSGFMKPNALAA
jgi:hypothetical protein